MDLSSDASILVQEWCSYVRGCESVPYFFCCCVRQDHDELKRLNSLKHKCNTSDQYEEIEARINSLPYDPEKLEFTVGGYKERALALEKFDEHRLGDTSFFTLPALTEFLSGRKIIAKNKRLYLETPPTYDEAIAILRQAGSMFLPPEYAPGEQGSDGKPDTVAS